METTVKLETPNFGRVYADGALVGAVRRVGTSPGVARWFFLPPCDARYPGAGFDVPVTCIGDVTPEWAVSRYRAHLAALAAVR